MSETGPVPHPDFFAPGKKLTGVVGALGGLCVFWTVLGLMFYTRRPPAPAPKGPEGRPAQEVLLEVRAQHELELKTYGWVDKEKGAQAVLDDDEPTLRPCDVFPDLREEYRKELARRANERKA